MKNLNIYYHGHTDAGLFFHSLNLWNKTHNGILYDFAKPTPLPIYTINKDKFIVVIPVLNSSYGNRWQVDSNPIFTLPDFVINSVNNNNALILLDYSNESGSNEFYNFLTQALVSRGLTNLSNVILLCQNRQLKPNGATGLRIFNYDYFIIIACLNIINDASDSYLREMINSFNNKEKFLLCLNATPRSHRIHSVAMLIKAGFFDNSLVSFPCFDDSKERDSYCSDSFFQNLRNSNLHYLEDSVIKLRQYLPLKVDEFTEKGNDLAFKIDYSNYKRTWCSFVTETAVDNNNIRITEKTFKALALGHPFIIYNHPFTIPLIREFGFETFHEYIPDYYDSITDHTERLVAIADILRNFFDFTSAPTEQLISYLSAVSSKNINWCRNGFLSSYNSKYLAPLFTFFTNKLST